MLDRVKAIFGLAVFAAAAALLLWSFIVLVPTLAWFALQAAITIAVGAAVITGWNALRR